MTSRILAAGFALMVMGAVPAKAQTALETVLYILHQTEPKEDAGMKVTINEEPGGYFGTSKIMAELFYKKEHMVNYRYSVEQKSKCVYIDRNESFGKFSSTTVTEYDFSAMRLSDIQIKPSQIGKDMIVPGLKKCVLSGTNYGLSGGECQSDAEMPVFPNDIDRIVAALKSLAANVCKGRAF